MVQTDMVPLRSATLTDHPYGHEGILAGLRKVGEKINAGRVNDDVISWVGHKLVEAGKPSGNLARGEAIFDAFAKQYAYMHDQRGIERMADAQLTLGDGKDKKPRYPGGDCFAEGTLLLRDDFSLVPIEQIKMGDRIWGLNGWTTVLSTTDKGMLPIDIVQLNNGSQLRLTHDHNMNVLVCDRHPRSGPNSVPCSCRPEERVMQTIKVSALTKGMVLPQPERLPFGSDASLAPEQAYVEGLYVADGWVEDTRFSISGQDGCPKEAQKREVERICKERGIHTYWARKAITVNDAWWASRMRDMGTHAPNKHLLSINLAEAQACETLRGVMADSGKNTHGQGRTFTTTSRLLAVQMRVLHKMVGMSCGWAYIENHGGLGKNPIWRLTTRGGREGYSEKLLRVREVLPEIEEVPCYDIQTEDGMVYLPEHDVTVHNCDDAVIAYGSACEAAGIPTAIVGAAFGADRAISHVLLMVSDGQGKWVYADPSAKGYKFGQYKTPTREIIIDTLTGEILCDDTMCSPRMAGRVLNDDALGSKFLSLSNEATPPAGAIDVFDLGQPSVRAPLGVLKGLGDVTALTDADRSYLTSVLNESKNALSELRRWFEVGSRACQIVGAPSLGNLPLFGPDDLQRAVNLEAMLEVAIGAWEDVLAGRRTIGLSEGGLFGADLVVESLASDKVYVGFDLKKRLPELYSIATNDRVNVAKSTLGAFPILGVAIAVAVISVAISGGVAADAWSKAKQAEAAAAQATAQAEYDLVKAGKTDELVKVQQARNLLATEQSKQTVGAQVAQAAQGVGDLAVKGFVAVGLFLLLREGIKAMKGPR